MLKKINFRFLVVILALTLGACNDKGKDFVGHWTETNSEHPATVVIEYDDSMYHIDIDEYNPILEHFRKIKTEAKAESSTVLSARNGTLTLRLENGKIAYRSREFIKSS